MSEQPEKTFIQNIMVKVPIWAIAALGIWFGAGKAGFPIWWQIEFVVFSFYALCFFILLDLPSLKPEKNHSKFQNMMNAIKIIWGFIKPITRKEVTA